MNAAPTRPEILTERLRLYPPSLADLEAHLEMDRDPEVMRYIGRVRDPEENRRRLTERIESGWPAVGVAFHVSWRARHEFLGWCGLWPLEEKDGQPVEIGYRYKRAAWGQGIGTEAAAAVLRHGFEALDLDPIVAVTDHENRASQNLLTGIGLKRAGNVRAYGNDCAFFVARRGQWLGPQVPS